MTTTRWIGLTTVSILVAGAAAALTPALTGQGTEATAVATATLTLTPVADAYVDSSTPSTNYGLSTQLVTGSSPTRVTYLKFTVSGIGTDQIVTGAKLRLHVGKQGGSGSPSGGSVGTTSTSWAETSLTYNTRPAIGPVLGSFGPVARDTWAEVVVTPAVTGNGTFSFGLTSANTDSAEYDSRETGAKAPQLVVTTGAAPPPSDQVLVGAGDIATCGSTGDQATANVLDGIAGTVFTAGDHAYPDGTTSNFTDCYASSWGRHKARTRPSTGNHDYRTAGASAYFNYFGAAAGDPAKGYYSYNLGNWHVVAINSNCSKVGGCEAGSAQEKWLRQDLAANTRPCTVAYWHHPLFSSGSKHSPSTFMRPLYQALFDHDAEIVVQAHNHNYERFAPQNASGGLDNTRGIRAFVAGTGGAGLYSFGTIQPNSQVRNSDTRGVLKLTLKSNGYDWKFVPVAGKTFTDSGSGTCH